MNEIVFLLEKKGEDLTAVKIKAGYDTDGMCEVYYETPVQEGLDKVKTMLLDGWIIYDVFQNLF